MEYQVLNLNYEVSLEFTNAFIPADLLNNNSFYDS